MVRYHLNGMESMTSSINLKDSDHVANMNAMNTVMEVYRQKKAEILRGGDSKAIEKHKKRGKLLARERIESLRDEGSPFLEIGLFAAEGMYGGEAPSAGIVTGIGKVENRLCMIVANDATVKGGTYLPMTLKKHLRAQEIAQENELPCLYLVDSGGAFLPLQAEVFPDRDHFGRIFFNQAVMSAKGIPQLAAVMGSCTAGGAYVPAMSDESIIVKGNGTIFLGGPPLVKAATGENVSSEELGGADVHTRLSGVADHFAEDDQDALLKLRSIVSCLGAESKQFESDWIEPESPLFESEDLYSLVPSDAKHPMEMREILARIIDGSRLQEFKSRFGTTLICAFARLGGHLVGILANDGILFSESSQKGAHFIELCNQRRIPLIFLQNITGFMVGKKAENEGIARHGAKLVTAVSTATVPKLTVIIGGSFGAGNYGMCGRAFDPRFLFMWPNAKISVMGGEQAANVLATIQEDNFKRKGDKFTEAKRNEIRSPILAKYLEESSAYYSSARLWDDGIIDPVDTRKTLILALEATLNTPIPAVNAPVYRM